MVVWYHSFFLRNCDCGRRRVAVRSLGKTDALVLVLSSLFWGVEPSFDAAEDQESKLKPSPVISSSKLIAVDLEKNVSDIILTFSSPQRGERFLCLSKKLRDGLRIFLSQH